jgi:hypothetical protein
MARRTSRPVGLSSRAGRFGPRQAVSSCVAPGSGARSRPERRSIGPIRAGPRAGGSGAGRRRGALRRGGACGKGAGDGRSGRGRGALRVGSGTGCARLGHTMRDRSARADALDQQPPTEDGQRGITVGHEDLRAVSSWTAPTTSEVFAEFRTCRASTTLVIHTVGTSGQPRQSPYDDVAWAVQDGGERGVHDAADRLEAVTASASGRSASTIASAAVSGRAWASHRRWTGCRHAVRTAAGAPAGVVAQRCTE